MFNRMYRSLLAVAAMAGLRPSAERQKPRRRRVRGSSSFKPNGAQECARRMRQIAAGYLTGSNGLLLVGARNGDLRNVRTACNSHGEVVRFY
jgi:hypothetical protein